ncbi:ABC transporter B family member 28-like protein, partial [Drosera capensis]
CQPYINDRQYQFLEPMGWHKHPCLTVTETFSAIRTVRSFSGEKRQTSAFGAQVLAYQASGTKLGIFESINESLTRLAVYVSLLALYCLGGSKVKAVSFLLCQNDFNLASITISNQWSVHNPCCPMGLLLESANIVFQVSYHKFELVVGMLLWMKSCMTSYDGTRPEVSMHLFNRYWDFGFLRRVPHFL